VCEPRRIGAALALGLGLALGGAALVVATTDAGAGTVPPPYRGMSGAATVRVGLETDLRRVVVPCCEPVTVEHGGTRRASSSGVEVSPGGQARKPTYKLQVAALKDEEQARTLGRSLERSTREPAQVSFDVSSSLYRVRLGRFADRAAAERLGHRLIDQGVEGAWVVEEGGGLEHAALIVSSGEPRAKVESPGRWVAIETDGSNGVRLERGRYRGRILVYLNDRGLLNVIDELVLEDYLRGVVPVEMGPVLYDSLDSLKAQAVAARTYTVRGLGGFAAEGFDICASPRCQVYGGMDAEHPLSDRAVAETTGEIVIRDGQIAEALYSASCGGHTEDVEVVFPERTGAHLRGVPCAERGAVRIKAGTAAAGASYADLKARSPAAREERAYFLGYGARGLEVRTGDERHAVPVAPAVRTFARAGDDLRGEVLDLAPGDRLRLMWSDERLIAVASDRLGMNAPAGPVKPWSVFRREDELRRSLASLYPGFKLRDLEVVSRGGSGRVAKLRLLGAGHETVVLEGLAVRWTMGTPETWFDLRRASEGGHKGWMLEGRGRGHGVGLCQIGAVAMSRRGHTYKEILAHYYAGARLGRLVGSAGDPGAGRISVLRPPG
jgi:peptidoglycan hydrolase-like amidase